MTDPGMANRGGEPCEQKKLARVEQFVETLWAHTLGWQGPERRSSRRRWYVAAAEMMPVDPVSHKPIQARRVYVVTQNISTGGIAVVHRGPIDWPHAAIRLTRRDGESMVVLTKVVRVRPIGHDHNEVAGTFVQEVACR